MKNFNEWGVRIRRQPKRNYHSIWSNLVTERYGEEGEEPIPLDPWFSEFYDVGITERCNSKCSFCYVSADQTKQDYTRIVESWKEFVSRYARDIRIRPNSECAYPFLRRYIPLESDNEGTRLRKTQKLHEIVKNGIWLTAKPFQIAIGSTGEPTVHPEFPDFLKAVYDSRVVPNYTTNGIVLASDSDQSEEILEATRNYVGGVAVSFGNKSLRSHARKAIEKLADRGECKVVIHELIGNKSDVDDFLELDHEYSGTIHYHVLLPLMAHGRSKDCMDNDTYRYLIDKINRAGLQNVAFGANFLPFLENNPDLQPDIWEYPRHYYSHNLLLKSPENLVVTPSSFDLTPIV